VSPGSTLMSGAFRNPARSSPSPALRRPQAVCHFSDNWKRIFDWLVSQVALNRARQTIEIGPSTLLLGWDNLQPQFERQRIEILLLLAAVPAGPGAFHFRKRTSRPRFPPAPKPRLRGHRQGMRVAHASTQPSAIAALGNVPGLRDSTSPLTIRTTHSPQVPSPPQGVSISTPAWRAASSSAVCDPLAPPYRKDGTQPLASVRRIQWFLPAGRGASPVRQLILNSAVGGIWVNAGCEACATFGNRPEYPSAARCARRSAAAPAFLPHTSARRSLALQGPATATAWRARLPPSRSPRQQRIQRIFQGVPYLSRLFTKLSMSPASCGPTITFQPGRFPPVRRLSGPRIRE